MTPKLEIAVVATEQHPSGDYRFSAEAKDFPGSFSFGTTGAAAIRRCQAVVLRLLAARMWRPEALPLREITFLLTLASDGASRAGTQMEGA